KWLFVGLPYGRLYAWGLTGESMHGRAVGLCQEAPPARPDGSKMKAGPILRLSADGRWAAGWCAGSGFSLWELDESGRAAGIKTKISLRTGPTSFAFSPRSDVLVGGSYSLLYVWDLAHLPRTQVKTDWIGGSDPMRWFSDGRQFLSIGHSGVVWSNVDDLSAEKVLDELGYYKEYMITPAHEQLIVLGLGKISLFERRLMLWGIPVYTYPLPDLEPRPHEP